MPPPPLEVALANDTWRVTLALARDRFRDFAGLLQAGVAVPVRAGCSVLHFLAHGLDLPSDAQARITTVFLDGKVVDALETTTIRDGASLALSAAMPGLVGATLRRGGAYSAMRSEITWSPDPGGCPPAGASGIVQLKLFNLLVDELGPAVLRHGILLDGAEAARVFALQGEEDGGPPRDSRVFIQASFGGQRIPTCR